MVNQKITDIYIAVKDGKMDAATARIALTHSGAVPTFFPVRLVVRKVQPNEIPGWSEQNNFKMERNEIVFRMPA